MTLKSPNTLTHPVEYHALRRAIRRCHNENSTDYKNYGQRGITVCDAWRDGMEGFRNFLAHIGPKTSDDLSLDRIDNHKGYEPNNVRWADSSTQNTNRRKFERTREATATINGVTKSLIEWAEISGLNIRCVRDRVKRGKNGEDLIKPSRIHKRKRE